MPPPGGPDGETTSRHRARSGLGYLVAAGITVFILVAAAAGATAWVLREAPFPSRAEVTSRRVISVVSADGHELFERSHLQLPPIDAKDMPNVVNAVLSIEDRRFYEHGAVDLPSVVRAFRDNWSSGRTVAGGSTITQQLVKMLFLDPERTYARKIREAATAIWLERHLTKDEILTSYLNNVYLGSGATGFPAAARLYFNKKPADLTLPEAAMLAGMINAPAQDDPLHDLNAARKRAATVLDAMVENRKLDDAQALVAKLHPALPSQGALSPPAAGWFIDWVYGKAAQVTRPLGGTIQIRTTLDLHLQELAANVVKSTLAKDGNDKHATQAALVAVRPDGAVLAMVGGRNYAQSQYNRAVQAQRQPGSSFKLFDYYAALRQGFGLNDQIDDTPVSIHGWEPENYGHHHQGRVSLADAFAQSLNDATVHLTQKIGIPQVIAAARDLGLRAPLHNNPSLALGTSEVSLIDLTSAYAAVRAGKAPVDPHGISGIKLGDNNDYMPVAQSVAQHSLGQYQGQLISLLQGVISHGTGRAAALNGFAAGKTGTSQDYRDAWFIGFDDHLVVGVWVGNDDHSPMKRVTGGSLPAAIWKQFMEQAGPVVAAASAPPPSLSSESATVGLAHAPADAFAQDRTVGQGSQTQPEAASPQCNVSACEQMYHSFRASDCTYQPYWGGPRRACDRQ
jgi:1A family penicillin-binding protein